MFFSCAVVFQVRQQVSAMLTMLCQCIVGSGENFDQNMAVNSVGVTRLELSVLVHALDADAGSAWPAMRNENLFALDPDALRARVDSLWSLDKMQVFTERVFRGCLNLVAGPVASGHRVFEYVFVFREIDVCVCERE
jgi:hypothetical protein